MHAVAQLFLGASMPIVALVFYLLFTSSWNEAVTQLFLDATSAFAAFSSFVPWGNFHWPNNIYIFGVPGKPLGWKYVWVLLFMAFAGVYQAVHAFIIKKKPEWRDMFVLMFAGLLCVYQTIFFYIHALFIQYYIPITWLYALFAAYLVDEFLKSLAVRSRTWFTAGSVGFWIIALILTAHTIRINVIRSKMDPYRQEETFTRLLQQIPVSEPVFPNYLFRPLSHPLFYGYFLGVGDLPAQLAKRYPPVWEELGKKNVKYLVLDDFSFKRLDTQTQEYITSRYQKTAGDVSLWIVK